MKSILTFGLALCACAYAHALELIDEEDCPFDPFYVGAAGTALLPGNGNSLAVSPAANLRFGWYATEMLAFEAEGTWAPNAGHQHLWGLAGRGLWHLFGYERFDPFVTLGAQGLMGHRHVFARNRHRSAVGPEAGLGFFYHLTERWSARADARALLCCDSPCGMIYSVSVGLQYAFGDTP